jgi:hypothetical protein
MTTSSPAAPRPSTGRRFLALGLVLPLAGVLGYAAQLAVHRLTAPWYLPVLTTLGVVFLVVALWRRRNVWRVLALLPVLLVTAVSWALLLGDRLPAYTGPVTAGQPFPAFATKRADGTPFSQRDLEGDQDNVLVFFRGRW